MRHLLGPAYHCRFSRWAVLGAILSAWIALGGSLSSPRRLSAAIADSVPDAQPATRPATSAGSQPGIAGSATSQIDIEDEIADDEARLHQAQADKSLDSATRKLLVGRYARSIEQLHRAADLAGQARGFRISTVLAPRRLQAIQGELAQLTSQPDVTVTESVAAVRIAEQLDQTRADLENSRKSLVAIEDEQRTRAARKAEIPQEIATISSRLAEANRDLASLPADRTRPLLRARLAELAAEIRALSAEIDLLNKEQASYQATEGLLLARRDLAIRQSARAERQVSLLSAALNEQNTREADQLAESARLAAEQLARSSAPLKIKALAEENVALARLRTGSTGLLARLRATQVDLAAAQKKLARLHDDAERVKADIAMAGLYEAMGRVLIRQQLELDKLGDYSAEIAAAESRAAEIQGQLIDQRRQLDDLADPFARAAEFAADSNGAERDAVAGQAETLLLAKRDILRRVVEESNAYLAAVGQLTQAQRQIAAEAETFGRYIQQRILWVRSLPPVARDEFAAAWQGVRWLVDPGRWIALARQIGQDVRDQAMIYLLAAVALAVLLLSRPRARSRIHELGRQISTRQADSLSHAPRVLAWTLWRALPWPALIALAAWRCFELAGGVRTEFAYRVGVSLVPLAWAAFGLAFLRELLSPGGLARRHFRWPADRLDGLRNASAWLTAAGLPILVCVLLMRWGEPARAGRLLFIGAMLLTCLLGHHLLRPRRKAAQSESAALPIPPAPAPAAAGKLAYVWYLLGSLIPLILAGAAAMGYFYAAIQLSTRLMISLGWLLGVAVLQGLLTGWVQQMRARLAAGAAGTARAAVEADEADRVTLEALGEQSRHLIAALMTVVFLIGLWATWQTTLPALSILNRVTLWTVVVEGQTINVSLGHLLLAVLAFAATVVAARNVPGLTEIAVLQPLRLPADIRFAVRTLCRYAIVVVGVVAGFSLLGIGWSKVQWLVAAMTVGLGFGLQEIFANFVSGLIILFERPMRVGDVISVGETTGWVTRIRMRSTTIIDWDRKELIVPNKEFITGRLINWTLSDRTLRITIPVGVAYGSDVELARRLLLACAAENPKVLKDPAPVANLEAFGDSALNFNLKVFLARVEHMFAVRDELCTAVERAFREHHIEIPVPQRDVRIRANDSPA